MPNPSEYIDYWRHALASPLGIKIRTSDRAHTQAKLYAARAEAEDAALAALSIMLVNGEEDMVYIVRRET